MNMQNKLFSDSETFQKERPTKISQEKQDEIWNKLANEIIDNKWSYDDVDLIIEDLKKLSINDSGYQKAKELEGYFSKANYEIETDFIEWLDNIDLYFGDALDKIVEQWVKAHDIKPKIEQGTKLIIKNKFSWGSELQIGNTIYINGFYEKVAQYKVFKEKNSSRNYLIAYEVIEQNCEIVAED